MLPELTLALLLLTAEGNNNESVLLGKVGRVEGEGWIARDISWEMARGPTGTALKVSAAVLDVEGAGIVIQNAELSCAKLHLSRGQQSCEQARITGSAGSLRILADGNVTMGPSGLTVILDLDVSGSLAKIILHVSSAARRFEFDVSNADLVVLNELVDLLPKSVSVSSAQAAARGIWIGGSSQSDSSWTMEMDYELSQLGFDNSDGTLAGAELAGAGSLNAKFDGSTVRLEPELLVESGEFLVDPLYVSFAGLPTLRMTADVQVADGVATADFRVSDAVAIDFSGSATLADTDDTSSIRSMRVQVQQLRLERAYSGYFQSAVEALGWSGLEPSGDIKAAIQVEQGKLKQLSMNLSGVALEDQGNRFLLQNLEGVLDYDVEGDSVDSTLSWEKVGYYGLALGAATTRFYLGGRQFQLLDAFFAPILDGGIEIQELQFTNFGLPSMSMDFRSSIAPISLELISRAFDWPILQGTLSGNIPRIQLRDGVGEVGGAIRLAVFDGDVVIDQLKLERIFGVLPTLAADIELNNLDLEQITGAFSFGKIQGRLEGSIEGLRMLGWEPVAFDARLQSPEKKRGAQKISQRALDNMSSIGGGAAALSQTFLGFFEQFSYRRLGIKCRLVDNICFMGGVAPASRGYYLVEGSGLPRIDVIGYSSQVDWPQLIRRLKAATQGGAPQVD